MAVLEGIQAELADELLRIGAIKFATDGEGFTLKLHELQPDAPKSPIFVNLRGSDHPTNKGPLTDYTLALIGQAYAELELGPHSCYTGIPEAGEPFAAVYGDLLEAERRPPSRLTLEKVTKDGKRHITDKVEGNFTGDETCLLLDDLITQADTKLEAINALRRNGLLVKQLLVVVDRCQGGTEVIEQLGVDTISVLSLVDMLDYYVETGQLDESLADWVREYLDDNQIG